MEKIFSVGRKQRLNYLYESWFCGKSAYGIQRDKYLTVHLWLSNLGKLLGLKITLSYSRCWLFLSNSYTSSYILGFFY